MYSFGTWISDSLHNYFNMQIWLASQPGIFKRKIHYWELSWFFKEFTKIVVKDLIKSLLR